MKVLALLTCILLAWLAEAWALMIAVGNVRGIWLRDLPPMSYGQALVLAFSLTIIVAIGTVVRALIEMIGEEL